MAEMRPGGTEAGGAEPPAPRSDTAEPYAAWLERLVRGVREGTIAPEDAVAALRRLPFSDLGFARVDHHRAVRQGQIEFVYAPGKTPEELAGIVAAQLRHEPSSIVVTRIGAAEAEPLAELARAAGAEPAYHARARLLAIPRAVPDPRGNVLVLTAGTSDLAVAEEVEIVAGLLGANVRCIADVGVAGIHRLLAELPEIEAADAIVVVAGMDGALGSVVGGVARVPVIACPTSVGYGATFGGLSALLSMLSSCAPGVAVVNVDDGVGAGTVAALIARGRG